MRIKRKENSESSVTAGLYSKISATVLIIIITASACSQSREIINPYESVDWTEYGQYKANFHTHTTRSDGRLNPHTVVDRYHQLGYDILAITDHNEVTWPWTAFAEMEASGTSQNRMESAPETMPETFIYENRDPEELGMIDIQANELSSHHHMGSFFNDHNGTSTEVESLEATAAKDGITMLYHPGRYQGRDPQFFNLQWYVDLYETYDHLFGMEVYNQGDRYPGDRRLWDSVLTVTMPEKPVWGYSNDDMHALPHLGRNWSVMLLPELNHEQVRYGLEKGLSYFVYAPGGHDGPKPPVIESVKVNDRKGTIEISAEGYDTVVWISGGEVLHEGSMLNLNDLEESIPYIRAELYGPGETVAGTQPFGIKKP
ncbi:MAG: hypothetical protein R6U58_04775 [Bacteroidales bacterium]